MLIKEEDLEIRMRRGQELMAAGGMLGALAASRVAFAVSFRLRFRPQSSARSAVFSRGLRTPIAGYRSHSSRSRQGGYGPATSWRSHRSPAHSTVVVMIFATAMMAAAWGSALTRTPNVTEHHRTCDNEFLRRGLA
jgi:hypothetical protein